MELCGTAGELGIRLVGCLWGAGKALGRSTSDLCLMSYLP